MFVDFDASDTPTPRGDVRTLVGGSGPPLLLLHGYPETHLMWRAVAPRLTEHFTVVLADLPGYGASFRPPVTADHTSHGKRAIATDLVAAMAELGFSRFGVAGHDRGARVAYRMALDHPGSVAGTVVMDIVPTGEVWSEADARFALGYWHWAFLAQPAPLPEGMILGDPDAFWLSAQRMGLRDGDPRYPPAVLAAYRAQLDDPEFVTAMCEDYRAGATVDRVDDDHDRGARTIAGPVRSIWAGNGALPRFYADPLAPWRHYAPQITGRAIAGAGHFLVEDAPEEVADELMAFFASPPTATEPQDHQ